MSARRLTLVHQRNGRMRRTNTSAKKKKQETVIYIETLKYKATKGTWEPDWTIFINPTVTLKPSGLLINSAEYEYRSIVRAAIDDDVRVFDEGYIFARINRLGLSNEEQQKLLAELPLKAATFFMEKFSEKIVVDVLGKDIETPPDFELIKKAKALILAKSKRDYKKKAEK